MESVIRLKRLYLDSNVFISMAREEISPDFTLLCRDSELFLSLCRKKGFTIVISFFFFDEVKNSIFLEREDILDSLENDYGVKLEIIEKKKEYFIGAREIARENEIHYADALHTAIARDNKCDLIISWNKKDFEKIKKIVNYKTPSEFIDEFL